MKATARKSLQGHPISNGLVVGRLAKTSRGHAGAHTPLIIHSPDAEWQKYADAQRKALQQLEELRRDASEIRKSALEKATLSEDDSGALPGVMTSYSMLLSDEVLMDRIKNLVFNESFDATSAILQAFHDVRAVVDSMEDEYLREKALDLDACEDMLLSALSDSKSLQSHQWSHLKGRIVITNHPSPQDVIRFHQVGVAGIIAEHGSNLSHAAILARSFNIPTVFGAGGIVRASHNGQMTILDAHNGKIIINPGRSELRKAEARRAVELMLQQKLKASAPSIARTTDGQRVLVFANADGPVDSRSLLSSGAEGIGLLRTEFLHLTGDAETAHQFSTHEDQLKVFFRLTAEAIAPRWTTFRLLDSGGDKPYPPGNNLNLQEKSNVSQGIFGLRGIRFLLAEKNILELQLRSLLRANVAGNIRILIPFVSDVDEIRKVKALVQTLWSEIPENERTTLHYPRIGAMIETPAAVQMLDHISAECDFLSIGSNDLTQHYLCVERDSQQSSVLFNSLHPAVLRSLKTIFDQQRQMDISVSLCGELASNPEATELLIGLGCNQFSCRTSAIPLIKEIIRTTNAEEAHRFAESILRMSSAEEIQQHIKQRYAESHGHNATTTDPRNRAS